MAGPGERVGRLPAAIGVIETLLGLVDRTWDKLEAEHQLKEKFGISKEQLRTSIEGHLVAQEPQ